ncbi:prolyl oligopeptidase family serine peptidase [bacterium]|nr:prolyl oligopeptidase family serine peptidase [bacterium]
MSRLVPIISRFRAVALAAALFAAVPAFALAWFIFVGPLDASDDRSLGPGDHRIRLTHDGLARQYFVHVPKILASRPPVVLMFHGAAANARMAKSLHGIDRVADREGFVAVYPDGTGKNALLHTWNAGGCCGYAVEHHVDDVGYVRDLLADLASRVEYDPARVFVTGLSNGGMMSYRLACAAPELFAGAASVSGPLAVAECTPDRATPILHIHGTDDAFARYEGGVSARAPKAGALSSVAETLETWRAINDCAPEPAVSPMPNADPQDGLRATRFAWTCERAPVTHIRVEGGGHTWPGGVRVPFLDLGPHTNDFDASAVIGEFFHRQDAKNAKE